MNELLLTPEEIKAIPLPEIEININDTGWCIPYCNVVAQAQLDKILNQPWLDKPDSEGWWWLLCNGELSIEYVENLDDWVEAEVMARMPEDIRYRYQKAIVPELEVTNV